VLMARPDHPLVARGTPARVADLLAHPLALMPGSFGIGQAVQLLAHAENVEVRPALTTNSLAALKRLAASGDFVALVGEFAAQREVEAGELAVVVVDHALFRGIHARAGAHGPAVGGGAARTAGLDPARHADVRGVAEESRAAPRNALTTARGARQAARSRAGACGCSTAGCRSTGRRPRPRSNRSCRRARSSPTCWPTASGWTSWRPTSMR
jgi:LysR substrate binding domain